MEFGDRLWDLYTEWVIEEHNIEGMSEEEIEGLMDSKDLQEEFKSLIAKELGIEKWY